MLIRYSANSHFIDGLYAQAQQCKALPGSIASTSRATPVVVYAGSEEARVDALCQQRLAPHMPFTDAACIARDDNLQTLLACKQAPPSVGLSE